MKSFCKILTFLAVVMIVAPLTGCNSGPRVETILNPKVSSCPPNFKIDKVILTDSLTIIDFTFNTSRNGDYIYINPEAVIVANDKTYPILGSKNVTIGTLETEPVKNRDISASLIFPALPKEVKSFDFMESPKAKDEDESGWIVKGISLEKSKGTVTYRNLEDNKNFVAKYQEITDSIQRVEKEKEMAKRKLSQQDSRIAKAIKDNRLVEGMNSSQISKAGYHKAKTISVYVSNGITYERCLYADFFGIQKAEVVIGGGVIQTVIDETSFAGLRDAAESYR